MTRIVRAGMTETRNAYAGLPQTLAALDAWDEGLDAVRDANIAHHVDLIRQAARLNVQVLCLGELCMAPYFALEERELWKGLAEDAVDGPSVQAMCAAAREHGMVIIVPIYELDSRADTRFNTAVVIDADGSIVGKYRKTHIPYGTNERASFLENFYYERSDGNLGNDPARCGSDPYFPVFETSVGKIGVAICYDRHFSGATAALARSGAEIVFCPAVTFGVKSERMWQREFDVDAARLNMFIGGSNRRGSEPPFDVEFFGKSHFTGPNQRPDPVAAPEGLVVADLNFAELASDSSGWNLAHDARPDIY